MRIIAGQYKGRKLIDIKGKKIRPTSDRIREALFSILSQKLNNAVVLDLFAGTGALGLEALSRGAAKSIFVDKSKYAITIINKNIELLNIENKADTVLMDACIIQKQKTIFNQKFDLIFMDPPYDKDFIVKMFKNVNLSDMVKDESILIAEHSIRDNDFDDILGFGLFDRRTYGRTMISFFRKN
jgi:16S rRNA (guanine966-N2)-methyltransferase